MQYSNLQSYNISPIYKLDGQTPLRSCLFLLLTIPFILRVLIKKNLMRNFKITRMRIINADVVAMKLSYFLKYAIYIIIHALTGLGKTSLEMGVPYLKSRRLTKAETFY